jgi:hypothetical protein
MSEVLAGKAVGLVDVCGSRRAVAVGGDELPHAPVEEGPRELLRLGPVAAEERCRVHLQRPAQLGQLVG